MSTGSYIRPATSVRPAVTEPLRQPERPRGGSNGQPVDSSSASRNDRLVDARTMVDIEHFDDVGLFVDMVDDTVGPAACAVTAGQRAEERFTDPARTQGQGGLTEFEHRRRHGLREPFGDGTARGGRPRAARLSEIRVTASLSPRISSVISRPSRSSTDTRTASGSPFRVSVIRSCCSRTRLARSDRCVLASGIGTGVDAGRQWQTLTRNGVPVVQRHCRRCPGRNSVAVPGITRYYRRRSAMSIGRWARS